MTLKYGDAKMPLYQHGIPPLHRINDTYGDAKMPLSQYSIPPLL